MLGLGLAIQLGFKVCLRLGLGQVLEIRLGLGLC
jgi:hypothetical protein